MGIDTPASFPLLGEACRSVPMALGKHLFSFRTQQLSPAAAIILRKRETSTVPNYKRDVREGVFFSSQISCMRNLRHPERLPNRKSFFFVGLFTVIYKDKETSERASLLILNVVRLRYFCTKIVRMYGLLAYAPHEGSGAADRWLCRVRCQTKTTVLAGSVVFRCLQSSI